MTNTENRTPTTEPAESLDDLRSNLVAMRRMHARMSDRINALESTIASAEADERPAEPVASPSDRDLIDALTVRVDAIERANDFTPAPDASQVPDEGEAWVQDRASQVPHTFDERALDETDAMLDMTGAFVTSTATVLRIRAEIAMKHEQYVARFVAVQHRHRHVEAVRILAKRETWRQALELVDRVIAERMS